MKRTIEIPKEKEDDEEIMVIVDDEISDELREKIHRAKPVISTLQNMSESGNPVHGAIVDLLGNKTFGKAIEQAGQYLESRIAKSATELPAPVDAGQVIESLKPENNLRCPKRGTKKHNDWKAAWRKVRGSWHGGNNYQQLSKLARVSDETIADIVKAGDAGLLD